MQKAPWPTKKANGEYFGKKQEADMDYREFGWKVLEDTRRSSKDIYHKSYNWAIGGKRPIKVLEPTERDIKKIIHEVESDRKNIDLSNFTIDKPEDRE